MIEGLLPVDALAAQAVSAGTYDEILSTTVKPPHAVLDSERAG